MLKGCEQRNPILSMSLVTHDANNVRQHSVIGCASELAPAMRKLLVDVAGKMGAEMLTKGGGS